MSVDIPKVAIAFGAVAPPQGDVIQCRVHLGCTKEVSSFEVLLQNWNKKYSPNGTYPITVGMDGHIDIGRGTNCPQIITCHVESVKCESTPTENYIRVSGRCWGERLFRRVVTKIYSNQKGEAIVKDLIDNFAGLSHVRDSTELIENTDTTYTRLEYENTPVFDILRYITESADKAGVIGYDFRVAPDAKFEFFPRNTKTSPISLSEKIEVSEYRKDIHCIRNRITVYGAAGRINPPNKDTWTDPTQDPPEDWLAGTWTTLSRSTDRKLNAYSVQGYCASASDHRTSIEMTRQNIGTLPCSYPSDHYKKLNFWLKWLNSSNYPPWFLEVRLYSANGEQAYCFLESDELPSQDTWKLITLPIGPKYSADDYSELWYPAMTHEGWSQINKIRWWLIFDPIPGGNGTMRIDGLYFSESRWANTQQDNASQQAYGLRELVEVDEELYSDNECMLRAKALLAHSKDPAEYLTVRSTVIDYGNTPLLPGDKIHVTLPNENVDADFRILSAEYHVDAKTQTLEITLELGRETPLLADYLYALRAKTDHLSRHKIAMVS